MFSVPSVVEIFSVDRYVKRTIPLHFIEYITEAKETLLVDPGLRLALVYGSAVTGTMRADSDVDMICYIHWGKRH